MFHVYKIPLLLLTLLLKTTSNSSDILYEVSGLIRVFKDGTIERLSGTGFVPSSVDPNTGVQSKDVVIATNLNISARLYLPHETDELCRKFPVLIYFHDGGFLTGSAFNPENHNFMNTLVAQAEVVGVSVNYRLAPEHVLPIGYNDSWLAIKWVLSHSHGDGNDVWLRNYADYSRVYVGGTSAGGNIAHNMAIRAGMDKSGQEMFDKMFLNFPHFWGNERIGDEESDPDGVAWIEDIWLHAYPSSMGFDDPASNPKMDPNLSKLGCKKVLLYTAEKDILNDRAWLYAETLRKSSWRGNISVVDVQGEGHVFNLLSPNTTQAQKMLQHEASFLDEDRVQSKSNSCAQSV